MTDVATRPDVVPAQVTPLGPPRLLPLTDLKPTPQRPRIGSVASLAAKARVAIRQQWLFGILVLMPILFGSIYFLGLAADRYMSEARYVVRNAALAVNPAMGTLLAPGAVTRSSDDAYAVNAFILSHDAVADISNHADLRAILGRAGWDPLWQFPNPFKRDTNEALLQRYLDLVSVKFDKTTGITTLTVQAFRPEDAEALALAILESAERFVNRLSVRSRDDALNNARRDLDEAHARVRVAQEDVTAFRNRERMVDPTRISQSVVETIGRLSLEIAQTNAQINEIARSAAASPQIAPLRARVAALEQQVLRERGQLAGTDRALAEKIAEYERLIMEKDFAEKLLSSAVNALESARLDVQRQQLYVERIVAPARPDWPYAPYRLLSILGLAFICWTVHAVIRRFRPQPRLVS